MPTCLVILATIKKCSMKEVLTLIHNGQNSQIYYQESTKYPTPTLLKVLKTAYPTEQQLKQFFYEYDLLQDIAIKGVRKIYAKKKANNQYALILEYIPGKTLKSILEFNAINLRLFLPIAIQLAQIVGEVHQKNIIHKDINPSNIIVELTQQKCTLIDFGNSMRINTTNKVAEKSGTFEGTMAYMAPEQTGRMNRVMDHRADLYAIGVTFYEMLTGVLPFKSQDITELVHLHMAKMPTPPLEINTNIPPVLSAIILKLLAKNPDNRYQSAFGLKYDLTVCLQQLNTHQTITNFPLCRQDFSGKLQTITKLYGRKKEQKALSKIFTTISQGATEILWVKGASGAGKSAFVQQTVAHLVTKLKGYFITGKFDKLQQNTPYYAWIQALTDLVNQLLTESDQYLAIWKNKILQSVGKQAKVLTDIIPNLHLLIGNQPEVEKLGPVAAQNRFHYVISQLLGTIAEFNHPLIIFLDNLQWADQTSLQLFYNLLNGKNCQSLCIIGAYRDNHVSLTSPIQQLVKRFKENNIKTHEIRVENLSTAYIRQLLVDSLHPAKNTETEIIQLTQLVFQKTRGNAFFVHQFLKSLYEQGLLYFDFQQQKWLWNRQTIQQATITDNVVELVTNQIQLLPPKSQHILKLASCIGIRFDLKTLTIIAKKTAIAIVAALQNACDQNLVVALHTPTELTNALEKRINLTNIQYKFAHNRIQLATYQLLKTKEKKRTHLQIGKLLLENTPYELTKILDNILSEDSIQSISAVIIPIREEYIFNAANQYNLGIDLITNQQDKLDLAVLNLIAGQRAKVATAYEAAFNYLATALQLLGQDNLWEKYYRFSLLIHSETAEIAYLSGNYEKCHALVAIVLNNTHSILDRINIYKIQINAYLTSGNFHKAMDVGLEILEKFGIKFPKTPTKLHIVAAFIKIKILLRGKQIEDLADLPEMKDIHRLTASNIITFISDVIFQINPKLAVLLIIKQIELFVQYGTVPLGLGGYAGYGIILCGVMNKPQEGFKFGQLAVKLAESLRVEKVRAKVHFILNMFIKYWTHHLNDTLESLDKTYQIGCETGNSEYAAYAAGCHATHMLFSGKPLNTCKQLINNYQQKIPETRQGVTTKWLAINKQYILNLTITQEVPYLLTGEACQEHDIYNFVKETKNTVVDFGIHLYKAILAYLFEVPKIALEHMNLLAKKKDTVFGQLYFALFHFYDSLIQLANYTISTKKEQKQILQEVKKNQKLIKKWQEAASMNFKHKYLLVAAELARIENNVKEARSLYDEAIDLAEKQEYINELALSYELTCNFYVQQKQYRLAKYYCQQAYQVYGQWGATAKTEQLAKKHPHFLDGEQHEQDGRMFFAYSSTGETSSKMLDVNSIIKASQTLSSEIVLKKLLRKMMRIVIENAGAESGALLLKNNNSWVIQAEASIEDEVVKVYELGLDIKEKYNRITRKKLPYQIINYVIRTQEPVILTDASYKNKFNKDTYIQRKKPKAILCIPLINHGKLLAIFYLENNLTTGAFTQKRIATLNILSTQLAISLENARLYQHTMDLNKAYERFVPSEFLSFLGKNSILDVELGDQVEQEMTVLFADIRNFTSISEKMTPKENFQFINNYLSQMQSVVSKHHGFIDKYIGDAIMALFPTNPDHAVKCAIAMLKQLHFYNQQYERQIHVGIGLNTGKLMLGTVGSIKRMDGTVISDAVNLGSRVETMTKVYGANFLITEYTYQKLADVSLYNIRKIDRVTAKGKSIAVTVYEIFDGDAPEMIDLKLQTLTDFKQGLSCYEVGNVVEAMDAFERVLTINAKDKAARVYIDRCKKTLKEKELS